MDLASVGFGLFALSVFVVVEYLDPILDALLGDEDPTDGY